MSRRLVLSTMLHRPDLTTEWESQLASTVGGLGLDISHLEFNWIDAWSEFMHMAIYGEGPNVSEFGTTWIDDFASMNVLRPFTPAEIRQLGGPSTFVPAVWNSAIARDGEVFAIPFLTDVRLVCYRRDLLARAGVNEAKAFDTPKHFEQTLKALQEAGIPLPYYNAVNRTTENVHHLGMWLWQAGEDFIDESGKHILLDRPNARTAMRNYLRLYRYMPEEARRLSPDGVRQMLAGARPAVFVSDLQQIRLTMSDPAMAQNLGLAIPLGKSYIGGSNLVIWRWTDRVEDAIKLLAHLTGREFQSTFPKAAWMMPGRMDLLDIIPLPEAPGFHSVIEQAVRTGRPLPKVRLWGLIEARLVDGMAALLADLVASPDTDPDLDALLDKHIIPIGRRLQMMLSNS